jgi:hypothetical protein
MGQEGGRGLGFGFSGGGVMTNSPSDPSQRPSRRRKAAGGWASGFREAESPSSKAAGGWASGFREEVLHSSWFAPCCGRRIQANERTGPMAEGFDKPLENPRIVSSLPIPSQRRDAWLPHRG